MTAAAALQEAEIDKFDNDPNFVQPDFKAAAHVRWLWARKKINPADLFGPYPEPEAITAVAVDAESSSDRPRRFQKRR